MLAPGPSSARRARVPRPAVSGGLAALVWLSASVATAAPGDTVELSGERFVAVKAAAEPATVPAPGPTVASRALTLTRVEGGFELQGTFELDASEPGWYAGIVAGSGTRIEDADLGGRIAPILRTPAGTMFAAWIEGPTTLKIRGFVDARPDTLELTTLPATRGRLRLRGDDRVLRWPSDTEDAPHGLAIVDGDVVGGAGSIRARLVEPGQAAPAGGPLVMGHAGLGMTVGDAELSVRARLRWDVRRGSLSRVRAKVTGAGADLQLVGPAVESWTRDGDELSITLAGETTDRVEVDLTWTRTIGERAESSADVPRVEPLGVFRADGTLQLSRDGELEVVPEVDGWTAIAGGDLPAWGQGLVEGKATAAYKTSTAGRAGRLDLLRFVPVPGPPTVVDVADYEIATTEDGRVLLKARYEIRNERASHLRIEAPPGLTIIGARVEQDTATAAKDRAGAWRIPLKRSLETVGGLLSFPVEVVMLGENEPWQRRERRELVLPTLDAPIAASRATLYLPPQYRTKLEPGDGTLVEDFSEGEGISYGLGLGAGGNGEQVAQADAIFQEAVDAYRDNDFERAQARLDELGQMGARNDKVANLQGNLDLLDEDDDSEGDEGGNVVGGVGGKADVVLERRIKEQAKARATDEFLRQKELAEEAERAQVEGDYAKAEQKLDEALELGDKLAKLEQRESYEQQSVNIQLASKKGSVSVKRKKKAALELGSRRRDRDRPLVGSAAGTSDSGALVVDAAEHRRADEDDEAGGDGGAATEATVTGVATGGGGEYDYEFDVDEREDEPATPIEPAPEPEQESMLTSERFAGEADGELAQERAPRIFSRARARFAGRSRGRRVGRATPNRPNRPSRPVPSSEDAAQGVAVYDFEDDNLDGLVLHPEGAATPTAPAPDPNERLQGPKATATGLSVVVPAIGQPQRYQQLLIEAGQTQTLRIDARKHRRQTRR